MTPQPLWKHPAALVLAAGVLLGTAGTAATIGPDGVTPMSLGGMRLAFGAATLTLVVPWFGGDRRRVIRLLRRPTIWVMAAGSGAYQPLFFGATNRAGVAVSTLVAVGSIPIFAGLSGWLFMRARPTLFWLFSTITAIAGLLFLSWKDLSVNDSIGLIMALGAGFCSGCYIVAAKIELNRGEGFLELPVAAYLLGSLMLSPMLVTQPLGWVVTPSGFLMSLYLGVVTMALANVFQVRGIRGLAPGPAATLSLADPLTATILGLVVLGESISAVGALGLALLFGALATQGAVIRNNR